MNAPAWLKPQAPYTHTHTHTHTHTQPLISFSGPSSGREWVSVQGGRTKAKSMGRGKRVQTKAELAPQDGTEYGGLEGVGVSSSLPFSRCPP